MVEDYLLTLSGLIWDKYLMVALIGVGVYYTVATRFVQIRYFTRAIAQAVAGMRGSGQGSGEGTLSSFQALTNALASCVGNGNIVGVATAVASGGPGAVFWMWLTGIVGMATKYAEIVLGILYREKNKKREYVGGPMYYIKKGMKLPWLGALFAILMFMQICGGGLIQANALSGVLMHTFDIPGYLIGIFLCIMVFLVVVGGVTRLGRVTEKLVPLMAVLYIVGSLLVVIVHWDRALFVWQMIIGSVFYPESALGGVAGYGVKEAMRFGVARDLYSNEAGEGSAPVLHSAARVKRAHTQGLMGIVEVFVDTIIICSVSAFTIIASGVFTEDLSPAVFILTAFENVSYYLRYIVFFAVILFAYSTIISQWYFGNVALAYLGCTRLADNFKYIFMIIIFLGTIASIKMVWLLQDVILGIMIIPNLLALLWLRGDVLRELRSAEAGCPDKAQHMV